MHISNAQIKAILDLYMSVKRAEMGIIPMSDISNHQAIKRFEKVLNDILLEKIQENNANNELFIQARDKYIENDIKELKTLWKMTIK